MPKLNAEPLAGEQSRARDDTRNRAAGSLTSFNAEARTVDVVLATDTPVRVRTWEGTYDEILTISPAAIDTTRLDSLALLDSHDRYSGLASRLGGIVPGSLRFEGGKAIVTAKISRNEGGQALFDDLEDGHVLPASVSFRPIEQTRTEPSPGGVATVNVIRWMPLELSIVSVPADPAATTRSEQEHNPTEGNPMPVAERNTQIRAIAETAGLDRAWADEQIDAEVTVDQARAAAFEAMRARGAAAATIRAPHNDTTMDNPEARVRAMGEALYARATPGHQVSDPARQFVGLGTVDHARAALTRAGVSLAGLSPAQIVDRALHTTSDFPLLLGDSVGRSLQQAYTAAPSGLKRVGRQTTATDFKEKHKLQLSEAPRLEKVNESGEFKSGTFKEEKQSYRLATYGKIFNISRQALVNDDLNAFMDLSRRMGQAAAATEAQLLVDLFLSNAGGGPKMGDGKNMFHADHNNLLTGAAFAVSALGVARAKMRQQVGISGELIAVEPKFLIVPATLETTAEQELRTTFYPDSSNKAATESMRQLDIVVEPRFTDATAWYLAADPASCDGLEYAYLQGEEGVQVETKSGWEVDGVSVKARLDFGASFVDFRSFMKNPGA